MTSKYEDELIVTPEWAQGGYIQFQFGGLNFNTLYDRDKNKSVYCNVGGYDPRQGPKCVASLLSPGILPFIMPMLFRLHRWIVSSQL